MPARQCNSIRQQRDADWPNIIRKLVRSDKCKPTPVILSPSFIWTQAAGGSSQRKVVVLVGGGGVDERGRVHTDRDRGMNRENWERQTREKEVEWWGGHCTTMHWCERQRGEREGVRQGERETLHWQILQWGCLRKKKLASHRHYRSILTDLLLPFLANNSSFSESSDTYPLIHPSLASWTCSASLSSKQKARDKERKGDVRERLDPAMICVSSQRYSSSSHAPLLAASYSLSFCFSISPSRSTHACYCCMATTC